MWLVKDMNIYQNYSKKECYVVMGWTETSGGWFTMFNGTLKAARAYIGNEAVIDDNAQEENQENSTAAQEGQEGSEMMTVNDLLTMMDLRTIDEVKMYCADGHDLGSMEIETAADTEYYGARLVKSFGFKHDEISEFNILVITLADTWHRDGTPENCEFWARVEAEDSGEYMVRCYTRAGNLAATYYANDEETAARIRVEHAASLGVYPGDREHWALFPTIWKKDAGGEYHRVTKYA